MRLKDEINAEFTRKSDEAFKLYKESAQTMLDYARLQETLYELHQLYDVKVEVVS